MKLFFHALHENELPFINGGEHVEWAPEITTWMSLAVIIVAMAVATIASLIKASRRSRRSAAARGATTAPTSEHRRVDGVGRSRSRW